MRIVIAGDLSAENPNHPATESALRHSLTLAGLDAEIEWRTTTALAAGVEAQLESADGLFLTTGSPYQSLDGALAVIRHARTTGMPFLGTCGGFQHVVLEGFRNVAGLETARHVEYDGSGDCEVITALSCSLAGLTMAVQITPGSRAASAYDAEHATERYYCQFGVALAFRERLHEAGLTVTGTDADGEPRIVERPDHPFFVATLFVPQASSTAETPHPLVSAFVDAARQSSGRRDGGPRRGL